MSVIGRIYLLNAGIWIRNVWHSTNDPGSGTGWLGQWKNATGTQGVVYCCVCNRKASVGGHIVLGDGQNTAHAPTDAASLTGGNRVFIVPLCGTCNNSNNTGAMQVRNATQILHLCAFNVDPRYDESRLTADSEEYSDFSFRRLCIRNSNAHMGYMKWLSKQDLDSADHAILQDAPISTYGRQSRPVYTRDSVFKRWK